MEFLTPVFAAIGIAAAAIPFALHMLRRAPTQQMTFSVVRFLKPARPKLTRRSRIEHWPLMLLRMLALVLIGIGFARPFLREVLPLSEDNDAGQSVTILVDRSASMQRDGLREQVEEMVREIAADLNSEDLLSIVAFSKTSQTLLSREHWAAADSGARSALIDVALENYQPDWLATHTGAAMRIAADDLVQHVSGQARSSRRRLVLITDFQRGSRLDELKSGGWPSDVDVQLKPVRAKTSGNVGATYVEDRRSDRMRVRLENAGDSTEHEFLLLPFDIAGEPAGPPIDVRVAPGQRRSIVLPPAPEGRPVARVKLLGDEQPFDNVVDLPETENPVVRVAHIGPAKFNDPELMRYYLQRVLSGNTERQIELVDLIGNDGVLRPVPPDVRLVVLTESLPAGLADSVEDFLMRSGTLLAVPPSADALESLQRFLPPNFQVTEADVDDYAMLGMIDFDHPLFAPFSEARFSDFSSIQFWRHRNLQFSEEDRQDGDWSVVARFDTGLPAIAEIAVGESGRMLVIAAGWHPDDSQLALSTRFAPLITRVLELASPAQRAQLLRTVGDTIDPGELIDAASWSLRLPDGTSVASDNADPSVMLETPGRYVVTSADRESAVSLIASVAASESRTEMLPLGQLQILGISVDSESDPADETDSALPGQLSRRQLEHRQQWWRWLLLAGLLCLLVESLWAAAIERRQRADIAN